MIIVEINQWFTLRGFYQTVFLCAPKIFRGKVLLKHKPDHVFKGAKLRYFELFWPCTK